MIRAVLFALLLTGAASAQAPSIPRTPDGHPDFYGTWSANFLPSGLDRLPDASGLVVGDAEAKRLVDTWWERRFQQPVQDPNENLGLGRSLQKVNGEWRTSQITDPPDGRTPLTQAGAQIAQARRDRVAARPDGPEARGIKERCIGGLVDAPLVVTPTDNLRQLVQTEHHLVIFNETDVGEARIVGIGAAPRPAAVTNHLGDSIGRWDGDTLVIETTNRRAGPGEALLGPTLIVRPEARVIERLSLLSPNELLYRFTVEDPLIYSRAWSAEYSMTRSNLPVFETACHEGNYAMVNMLAAAREAERKAARGKK